MDILIRQLDEICRESQELRQQLGHELGHAIWPERRRSPEADADAGRRGSRRASDHERSPEKR